MTTWSKEVFARNLQRYMTVKEKNQKELAAIVGVSAPTVNEWLKAKKYPRIDKIEILANYFGILKSDLIEDKEEHDQHFVTRKEIGTAVYNARNSKNITLKELALKIGCPESLLKKIEKGNSYTLTKDVAKKLSDILGISPLLILGLESITPEQQQAATQKEKQSKLWADAYSDVEFSDAEFEDIMRYANFIISSRKK